jgi:hypothetical protein
MAMEREEENYKKGLSIMEAGKIIEGEGRF